MEYAPFALILEPSIQQISSKVNHFIIPKNTHAFRSFPPYMHVVSFASSVDEGKIKLFLVFLDCFTFHLFAFAVLFFSFTMRHFTPHRIVISDVFETPLRA